MQFLASIQEWRAQRLEKRILISEALKVSELLVQHLEELGQKETSIPGYTFDVTQFLLKENVDAYRSIAVLYKAGHFRSCMPIARSILENSINLLYIYKENTEKRARNFKLFSTLNYLKRARNVEPTGEAATHFKKLLSVMEASAKEYTPEGSNALHWDGKSFKKICEELNLNSIYSDFYTRLSEYTHTSFMNKQDYDTGRPYNYFLKKLVFRDTTVITAQALKEINEKYDLLFGAIILNDYPQDGMDTLFGFGNKAHDSKL